MNAVRIPIPRPLEAEPETRGGAEEEELRRTRDRAEAFAEMQRMEHGASLTAAAVQRQAALVAVEEARQARMVSARAATVRAEGTRNLVLGIGAGFVGALVLGAIFIPNGKAP